MPSWTKEQSLAIYESGKNIIVSAGAGSGKTAVLSERVLKKIENGVDIDRLLILTFTKAAASEMKNRIRKKIKSNKDLIEQLNRLDSSYITTFDSYSLSIVKKYHYLLNIKKNVSIIEENILNIKIEEYLEEIFEKKYQSNDEKFFKLISDFCIKDDSLIKKTIININKKLNMKYDKEDYLNNYINDKYNDNYINENINKYVNFIKEKISYLDLLLTRLSDYVDCDYYSVVANSLQNLFNATTYEEIKESSCIKLPNLKRGTEETGKLIKKEMSEILKEINELTIIPDTQSLKNNIYLTKGYVEVIIDIIKELDLYVNDYKHQNDLYDFNDISKMAIKIVKENKDIREELKNYFQEILVDEYQDTNDLQEEFITSISNNNLYMVGDIKQSIYRFRNANPNIFRTKYNNYAVNNGGMKIDLLKNFRSREEVLANINLIFDYIMDDAIGGAEYKEGHRMVFGNTTYNIEGKTNQDNNLEIYNYPYDKKNGFTKEEIEAFIIANDILDKVNNHYQVFDKDEQILRDINYSDFSILIDRTTSFELYKKVFLYKHIPLSIFKDEYLTSSDLLLVIKNIFKLLDVVVNKKSKKELTYSFLSIGRSFLFNYTDDYLFNIIKNDKYQETIILEKINVIKENIDSKSISMILDEIIHEFDLYNKLIEIGDLKESYVKVEYLYSLSTNLNQMSYTYQDFIEFIDNIIENGTDIKFSLNKEESNSVKIMTIHKSKGLEYHICYFPGLTPKFNDSDIKEKFIYDNNLGIISPYFNEGIGNTFYRELFKENYEKEEISEKIRLFYVALTRAKEKMIFVLPMEEMEEEYNENELVVNNIRLSYRSFKDILKSIKSKVNVYIKDIDINTLGLTNKYNIVTSNNLFDKIIKENNEIETINYQIPKLLEKEQSHFSKSNTGLITKEQKEVMELGTKLHYIMETLDFINPNLNSIEDKYQKYITRFLESDLLKDIKNGKVYKEYEFIEKDDNNVKTGIIDLMIEYSDHIDIIDYKLKNINDSDYNKQLLGYKKYIEKLINKKTNIYLYSLFDSKYREVSSD